MQGLERHWLRAIRFFANECHESVPCSVETPRGPEDCVIEWLTETDHLILVRTHDGRHSKRPVHFSKVMVRDQVARELEATSRVAHDCDTWRSEFQFDTSR